MSTLQPWPDETATDPAPDWVVEQAQRDDAERSARHENFGQLNWAKNVLSTIVLEGASPTGSPAPRLDPSIRSYAAQVVRDQLQREEDANRLLAESAAAGERARSCAEGDNAERAARAHQRATRVMAIYN